MNKHENKGTVSNAYTALKLTYSLIPIAAGADKFLNILTDWSAYAAPAISETLGLSAGALMMIVGVIEIAAGLFLFFNTKIGAYVVSAWLVLIALSLIISGQHFDVAVRDIVMAVGAYALGQMAREPQGSGAVVLK